MKDDGLRTRSADLKLWPVVDVALHLRQRARSAIGAEAAGPTFVQHHRGNFTTLGDLTFTTSSVFRYQANDPKVWTCISCR